MNGNAIFSPTNIDAREFRAALGMFPTGVAVVTADGPDGNRIGMTITSFNSVSLDPPLILFSIGKNCLSLTSLAQATHYSINILGEDHQHLSTRFSRALEDKWSGVQVQSHSELPFTLSDSIATFQCSQYAQHDGGDHIIFVGRVLRIERKDVARPLVFFSGRYGAVASAA
jgi:flavin reductase (DIM6/NTAB) family NADH-FMN oxidoreductase RutF